MMMPTMNLLIADGSLLLWIASSMLIQQTWVLAAFLPPAPKFHFCNRHYQNHQQLSSSTLSQELESDLFDVYWLDEYEESSNVFAQEAESSLSLGQAIGQGEAVVCIPNVASLEETNYLFEKGLQARESRGAAATARGRSRFSVSDPTAFDHDVVLTCEEILLRVLDHVDDQIPSIYQHLFVPSPEWVDRQPLNAQGEQPTVPPPEHLCDMCDGTRELYMMGELEWSEGEPAINIYEQGGLFGCHKDHLALTVLIPLTSSNAFEGGGTGFWSGNSLVNENPSSPPNLILKPEAGSALVFGGDVTHAGMPVEAGYRSVLVCSFSTKTPASSPDRLHGLQAPPQTSPNFKGTI